MLATEKDIPIKQERENPDNSSLPISNSISTTNNSRVGSISSIRALCNEHNNNNSNTAINANYSSNSNENPIQDINLKLKPNEISNNVIPPSSPRCRVYSFRKYQPHHQPSISKRIDLFESSKNNDTIPIISDANNSDDSNIKSPSISSFIPSICQLPNLSPNSNKELEKKSLGSNIKLANINDGNAKQSPSAKKTMLVNNQPPPPLLPPFESKLASISPDKISHIQSFVVPNSISADKGAIMREELLNELEETLKKQEEDHLCIICLEYKREYAGISL
jgi:hypothetical protein